MSYFCKRGLIIPDQHAPYHHPDTFPFLYKIKTIFGPFDRYINLGDETDGHAWSYHDSSPALANSDLEFDRAKKFMKTMYEFTENECHVMKSNHGSLAYRKAKTGKIPSQIMRGAYERALEAPPGWHWHNEFKVDTVRGPVNFIHGFSSVNTWAVAQKRGESYVTGHHHTKFCLRQEYLPNIGKTIFAAQAGCLIDRTSEAFSYAATNGEKQKLGAMVLLDGIPIMIAMKTNSLDRWIGEL